ncbi:MAG TPA: phosphoribosyltransferase family protein [Candidatus Xenobia bacterium]|jgi:putative phosphoribosyl transferase
MVIYEDRREAGRLLAQRLAEWRGRSDVVVLGLPRGGMPVAYEVARGLRAPLDVFVVRKLGVPGQEELAMGAIATGHVRSLNHAVIQSIGITERVVEQVAAREQAELDRRERYYRDHRPPLSLRDRVVILVDDGLATGASMRAALEAVRTQSPRQVIVAVPVGSPETCHAFRRLADELICLEAPDWFDAVGRWYADFSPPTDEEVRALLDTAKHEQPLISPGRERLVTLPSTGGTLRATLAVPDEAKGLVLFAHGSGSSRLSPRNRYVAAALQRAGLATLLLDLLTETEDHIDTKTGHLRFDIPFLAGRLHEAREWVARQSFAKLPLGYFGASTGAAAALLAAAGDPDVFAVVSRGGRPDLAGDALRHVRAPTLLLVGSLDPVVLDLNRQALEAMPAEKQLLVVPGATHLFQEPGTLERVAEAASQWFLRHAMARQASG